MRTSPSHGWYRLKALLLFFLLLLLAACRVQAPPPDFSLTLNPTSLTVQQGASGTTQLTLTPQNGFTGQVSLALEDQNGNAPSGITLDPTSLNVTGTGPVTRQLTVAVAQSVNPGTYALRVKATSGNLTKTANLSLTVQAPSPPPDFSISLNPTSLTIQQGASGTTQLTLTPQNGFTGQVTLSLEDQNGNTPSGITLSPSSVTVSGTNPVTQPLTLSVAGNVPPGQYALRVRATGGGLTRRADLNVQVTEPPSPPAAPSALKAVPLSPTEIELSWVDNASNEEGFAIERSTDGTSFTPVGQVGADTTTYRDTVPANTTYYYRVRAFNQAGPSPYSNVATNSWAKGYLRAAALAYGYLPNKVGFVKTSDGGYILASTLLPEGGPAQAILVKLNPDGSRAWAKGYQGGGDNVYASTVRETPDGGFVVAGLRDGALWVMRTDSQGEILWHRTYRANENLRAISLTPSADGGYAISATLGARIGQGAVVVKLDPTGGLQWERAFYGAPSAGALDIIENQGGGYTVVGAISRCDVCGPLFWVLSLTPQGQVAWQLSSESYGRGSHAFSVIQDRDGSYLVVGHGQSLGADKMDLWLLRVSPDGQRRELRSYSSSEGDLGGQDRIIPASDGGFLVYSFRFNPHLVKLGPSLEPQWARVYDDPVLFGQAALVETPDRGFLVANYGFTREYGISTSLMRLAGDGTLPSGRYRQREVQMQVFSGEFFTSSIPLNVESPNLQEVSRPLTAIPVSLTEITFNPRP